VIGWYSYATVKDQNSIRLKMPSTGAVD